MAPQLRARLLRNRNDANLHAPLRPRPAGYNLPRLPAPSRRDDRGRHRDEQNGTRAATVL